MSILQHGLTPKMKPLSPKRTALIAALDVGTSKVACLIGRLKPNPRRDTLRRRSHTIEVTDGGFLYAGKRYRSLSQVARAITGARWSGPRFFGL